LLKKGEWCAYGVVYVKKIEDRDLGSYRSLQPIVDGDEASMGWKGIGHDVTQVT